MPQGGRKQRTGLPDNSLNVVNDSCISRRDRRGDRNQNGEWCIPWLPTSCPRVMICRTRSGYLRAFSAIIKKVPETPLWARISRISGVKTGSGPSSKVRATLLPASPLRSTSLLRHRFHKSGSNAHIVKTLTAKASISSKFLAAPQSTHLSLAPRALNFSTTFS